MISNQSIIQLDYFFFLISSDKIGHFQQERYSNSSLSWNSISNAQNWKLTIFGRMDRARPKWGPWFCAQYILEMYHGLKI